MSDGERTADLYDAMASWYSAGNEVGAHNAYYERPAMKALLGDVRGRRVLEVGCGSGALTEWLAYEGAEVTAIDVSAEMVRLSTERVGAKARVLRADASQPLVFAADDSFDTVVASLVLHYIEDWRPVLAELRRVLRPDGVLLFSTHHPMVDWELHPDDYFATVLVSDTWRKEGRAFDVTFWRRPLTAMCEAIAASGFVIERLVEPPPSAELAVLDPEVFREMTTSPTFLFFQLRPQGDEPAT